MVSLDGACLACCKPMQYIGQNRPITMEVGLTARLKHGQKEVHVKLPQSAVPCTCLELRSVVPADRGGVRLLVTCALRETKFVCLALLHGLRDYSC